MSNDLHSILARHNLKGINVANFSSSPSQRPTPQQNQPYQYPASVSQPRAPYTWTPPPSQGQRQAAGVGQGQGGSASATVRPSFAWPAPPQPRYTIDPRHYSYDIWGKAPVFSLTGEDEEDEAEAEAEEDDDAQEGETVAEDNAGGKCSHGVVLILKADVI
jgi:hypothetical protein